LYLFFFCLSYPMPPPLPQGLDRSKKHKQLGAGFGFCIYSHTTNKIGRSNNSRGCDLSIWVTVVFLFSSIGTSSCLAFEVDGERSSSKRQMRYSSDGACSLHTPQKKPASLSVSFSAQWFSMVFHA